MSTADLCISQADYKELGWEFLYRTCFSELINYQTSTEYIDSQKEFIYGLLTPLPIELCLTSRLFVRLSVVSPCWLSEEAFFYPGAAFTSVCK